MEKYEVNEEQRAWSMVKEEKKLMPAKRVDIVSVRLVKERILELMVPGTDTILTTWN